VSELWDQSSFFFVAPETYDEKVVKKRWKESTPGLMRALSELLEHIEPFTTGKIESEVKSAIEAREWGMGAVMNAWRLLMVGTAKGPSLFHMAALLGKEEVLRRIEAGIKRLS
jgi:glutamyl-tRNA synthetase